MRIQTLVFPVTAFICIGSLLTACSAETPVAASSPKCEYEVQPHTSPKLSTYADELNIPYKQDKLVEFMWADKIECYGRQFAPMNIYRVPHAVNSGAFKDLREAPQKSLNSWRSFEIASGNMLMGLTTFRFEPGANERILDSTILLRADATQWHLWHEFSHFIIGTDRAHHHDQSLRIADQLTLEKQKKEALAFHPDEVLYSQKLQDFFNSNHEYLVKRYIDEIVIEATLIFLTQQQGTTPGATAAEVDSSINLIQFFEFQLSQHIDMTTKTIEEIKAHPLSKAQMELLDMHLQRMSKQREVVNRIVLDSVFLSRGALL